MPGSATSLSRRGRSTETGRLKFFSSKSTPINLALQGGGAHGAFTWGVLDRLLEEETFAIGWVSGTSAGAVNAVALAAGLAEGGRDGARAKLKQVWDGVQKAGVPDLLRLNPFLYSLSRTTPMAQMASLLSPYDFNPLGFDPLRRLLAEVIDFKRLQEAEGPELLIAATEIATGHARLFRRRELTLDAVLASCCLPTLHHAVIIEGRAYWDGGFSANPDLVTLAGESPADDTLIVLVNPFVQMALPTGAREISGHANRLTFNAPLLRDVELIETARDAFRGRWRKGKGRLQHLAAHRFHLIEAEKYTGALSHDSKMKPDKALLTSLHSAGRTEAGRWLDSHRRDAGRRATVDLAEKFLHPKLALLPRTAAAETPPTSGESPSASGETPAA